MRGSSRRRIVLHVRSQMPVGVSVMLLLPLLCFLLSRIPKNESRCLIQQHCLYERVCLPLASSYHGVQSFFAFYIESAYRLP